VLPLLALVFVPEFGWAGAVASLCFPLDLQPLTMPDCPGIRQSFAMGRTDAIGDPALFIPAAWVYRGRDVYRTRKLAAN